MNFGLVRPCPHCPFRNDIEPFLTRERAEEIAEAITTEQKSFTCHETTIESEDEDEDGFTRMIDGPNAQHCAGALIMLEKMNMPNQMMRIMERIGCYDRSKLDMDAPVFEDTEEFIDAH